MIVIQVLGISDASTQEQLQAITKDLHDFCHATEDDKCYVAFPRDWMLMDLGVEIVALISGVSVRLISEMSVRRISEMSDMSPLHFADRVWKILKQHFPPGTLIGTQVVAATTARELCRE